MRQTDAEFLTCVRTLAHICRSLLEDPAATTADAPYSATESWVISEVARQDATEVTELRHRLRIDSGYLSRILSRFQADRLITRQPSPQDRRRQTVRLTARGRTLSEAIDARAADTARARLARLTERDRRRLLDAIAALRDAHGEIGASSRVVP